MTTKAKFEYIKQRHGEIPPGVRTIFLECEYCKKKLPVVVEVNEKGKFKILHSKGHFHHKDGNPENNSVENLQFLCEKCHKMVHLWWKLKDWLDETNKTVFDLPTPIPRNMSSQNRKRKRLGRWDTGAPFDWLKNQILSLFRFYFRGFRVFWDKQTARHLCCATIALIQLRNGLRASEAIKAFETWISSKKTEFEVEAKGGVMRPVIIPKIISRFYPTLKEARKIGGEIKKKAYIAWMQRKIKVNSHTLRYAFIRKMVELNVPADVISKVIGHKSVEGTYYYEQTAPTKIKMEILRKIEF